MRGVKFELRENDIYDCPLEGAEDVALGALIDVADWLGYSNSLEYNIACVGDPREVRRRLREAV